MQFRSTPRAESPSHQQLYKRNSSSPVTRRRSSVTPSRPNANGNSLALAVVSPGTSSPRASCAGAPADDMVYVADVNPVYSVTAAVRCFVPINDRVMWSGEFDGSLCVRALPKGTALRTLPGREGTCCISLLHVPGEEQVWAGFQDGYMHVYDARSLELVQEVMAHGGGLNCMTLVDDTVFTGGADWKVCQWSCDGGTAQVLRTLHGHRGGVRSFAVYDGPTGAVLFSGSDDSTIRAWDPYLSAAGSDSGTANIHTFTGHRRAVLSLTVVAHVNQLWSGGEDMTVRVWDLQTLECVSVLRSGHTAPIANLMVVESRVWSADKHGHILLWDITTRSLLQDLADRVPYWGISQGMILAMQKVQPTTAYKVWTAASNGVLQCWNAETVPVVFDDVPVAAGMSRLTPAPAIVAGGSSGGGGGGAETGDFSVLTGSTNRSNNGSNGRDVNGRGGRTAASPSQSEEVARMRDYVQRLEHEMHCVQRDSKLNYEKYRLEVQLEMETQQLLAQENARLRDRVKELEEGSGAGGADAAPLLAAAEGRGVPAGTVQSARRTDAQRTGSVAVAAIEAWTAEMDDLRRQLKEAHQQLSEARAQLDEALRNHRPEQQQLHSEEEEEEDRSSAEKSPEINVADLPTAQEPPAADASRQFTRQDKLTKLPSVTADDALNDGAAPSPAATTTQPFSALLSTPHEDQWDTGAITRTTLARHFTGDDWDYLMNEKPYELQIALAADLCAGLGVAPTQLERVDVHNEDNFSIEVDVVHPTTVPSSELERRMRDYRFPGIMKMLADAYTTAKTAPDTAEATIIDLQEQLVRAEKALAEALEREDGEWQAHAPEPSPEPQQPYSHLPLSNSDTRYNNNNVVVAAEDQANAAGATAEQARLKDANAKLQSQLQDQQRTIQQLQNAIEDREYELSSAHEELQRKEGELELARQQLRDAQEQQLQTPKAARLRESGDSSDSHGVPRCDDTAPPALDRVTRKTAGSESGRTTELIAVPLAQEMMMAAAAPGGESNASQSDQQLQQALQEARERIAALEAERKEAEAKAATAALKNNADVLSRQGQPQTAAAAKLDASTQKQNDELRRANDVLTAQLAALEKQLEDTERELKVERQKLPAAAAVAKSPEPPLPASSFSDTKDKAGNSDDRGDDVDVQQLRDDHEALKNYVRDQLKPLISRLKRARGELQLDKDRLLQRLTAEQKAVAATALVNAGDVKKGSAAPAKVATASTESTATSSNLNNVDVSAQQQQQQLRDDYEALDRYLHEQLKPMISRLKRARGELQLDLTRAQEDVQQACNMYEEAAAALEEAHMREEKMGETVEALQTELEAEQRKNHSYSNSNTGVVEAPVDLSDEKRALRDAAAAPSTNTSQEEEEVNRQDAIDRLVAQNLDLSVQLADAEMVIAHLQEALGHSANELSQQHSETHRLLDEIDAYQHKRRSHSDNVPSVSTSDSLT